MVLVRDRENGPMLALVTTDLSVTGADLVARYTPPVGDRGHVLRHPADLGVGQARNRTAQAVTRTWAFGMYVYTLVVLWYALHSHRSGIVTDRRVHAPWYLSKTDPSFADMLTAEHGQRRQPLRLAENPRQLRLNPDIESGLRYLPSPVIGVVISLPILRPHPFPCRCRCCPRLPTILTWRMSPMWTVLRSHRAIVFDRSGP
jgi:hypothetical protein